MNSDNCYATAIGSDLCSVSNTAAIVWYSILGALIVTPILIAGVKALWDMWYYR